MPGKGEHIGIAIAQRREEKVFFQTWSGHHLALFSTGSAVRCPALGSREWQARG